MKNLFAEGDVQQFTRVVQIEDTARFEGKEIHPVYSTFAVARDAEWTCRLFVLQMLEDDEEGIGTFVNVRHYSPATVGSEVRFVATIDRLNVNEIVCRYTAHVGDRLIAEGEQGQKILKHEKLRKVMEAISS